MVHRLNNILNNNNLDDEEIAINEIQDLKIISPSLRSPMATQNMNSFRFGNLNNNSNININSNNNNINNMSNKIQTDIMEEDILEIDDSQPSSPQKKFKSSTDEFETISNNNINNNKSLPQPISSVFNKNNFNFEMLNKKYQQQQQSSNSSWSVNNNNGNNNNNNNGNNKKDQEVINSENGESDSDSEYDDDDYEEDENDFEFSSKFDEMKGHPSSSPNNLLNSPPSNTSPNSKLQIYNYQQLYSPNNNHHNHSHLSPNGHHHVPTTPITSPKTNPGTPSRPFPTLDYKIKSESVKQNPDGTYSCPYPTCNKTIKGNKGNLSSHLRWHRRLDAEAGELRDSNPVDEGEEEFTTPIKPSQRGIQLRNQMIRYGLNLFRQDSQGKYLCFFDNCNLRMLTNFSRHIAKHERKNDRIKPDLVSLIPTSPYQPSNNMRRSHSSPSSPTTLSSNFSPLLIHNSLSSAAVTPICQSPLNQSSPFSPLQTSASPSITSSPIPNGSIGDHKNKRKLHVKISSPNPNSNGNHNSNNATILTPHSEPCTPTTHKINPFAQSPSFQSPISYIHKDGGIISITDNKSKGKVDSLIAGDNNLSILSSPQPSLLLSPSQSDFSAVPNSPTSPLRSSRYMNTPLSPLSQSTPSLTSSPIIINPMNSLGSTSNNLLPIPNTLTKDKDISLIDNNNKDSNNDDDKENNNSIFALTQLAKPILRNNDIQWEFRRGPLLNKSSPSSPTSPSTSPSSPFQPSIVPSYNPLMMKKNKGEEEFIAKSLLDLSHINHNDSD
ncbi:hypothetical protein DICPUDRAFT_97418 [Dictyostelium purpureum]|uniref:Uncharacterized protein n=1 Tax=Dictyostelium purpureum TaxID=5786 RepID=F0ZGJ5_DICPU|nr:uncharacterized protein DICPUDRAFT_97418 [Dictyostelium purpureum]EGC36896.1 hypothetical protein DICPUDRAFT_97418 [Dictyostelium purpureum]|eukprot:XP_003286539.1 hypothetical protein DICPUDRAFT_97418 [Dictyostelium purpureum]